MTEPEMCRLCDVESRSTPFVLDANGLCQACKDKLGLVVMPPARRPAVPCTRCNRAKFIRVIPREHAVYAIKNGYSGYMAPMTATFKPNVTENWVFPGNTVGQFPTREEMRGMFETYICAHCGFVEWYCHDPESIPIGPEYMSEVVEYATDTPYR